MTMINGAAGTAQIIKKYGFTFQKRLGQNFLTDEHVLDKIIDAAGVCKSDGVIEIGPGIGTMTRRLCEAAGKVVAVEIDNRLIPILEDTLSGCDNVRIINDDIMKTDIRKLIEEEFAGMNVKVAANLPYYITTPIIMELLEKRLPIDSITIMVQKEVADRMRAKPGTKDYGALSLAVQYYADTYYAANVPPNCFIPRPKVGSGVIRLDVRKAPEYEVQDEKLMFDIIRSSFNQRRKTLVNAVSNNETLSLSKEDLTKALIKLGLPVAIRGEALDLSQFAALSNILTESGLYGKISK